MKNLNGILDSDNNHTFKVFGNLEEKRKR